MLVLSLLVSLFYRDQRSILSEYIVVVWCSGCIAYDILAGLFLLFLCIYLSLPGARSRLHRRSEIINLVHLIGWVQELNTAEDFILFYEEMLPSVQSLSLIIMQKERIFSNLVSRLQMKARLSLEPILRFANFHSFF